MQAKPTKLKIGLALGGGGARGLAHIGVLKALQEARIPIHLIAGTSMGAVIGGTYAVTPDPKVLEEKLFGFLERETLFRLESLFLKSEDDTRHAGLRRLANFLREIYIWKTRASKKWIIDSALIEKLIHELVGETSFEECVIPFIAVSTDLYSGEKIILGHGKLKEAILASSAIPGTLAPVELFGRLLADGGILEPIPVKTAKDMGMDLVIAVDVGKEVKKRKKFRNLIDIVVQAENIKAYELSKMKINPADIIIEPDVGHISWAHFSKARECIRRGEIATWSALPKLKLLISQLERKKFFGKILPFAKKPPPPINKDVNQAKG
ncbi:MAG: patatin-like phospholipase family protein [Chlamydiae bacterium]|nr:patatin-like phospholipase family protein [Chlamydiota bacterium]MBI3266772.1 patatin-like phospholipase family protein [Chlamydiota bacterium]